MSQANIEFHTVESHNMQVQFMAAGQVDRPGGDRVMKTKVRYAAALAFLLVFLGGCRLQREVLIEGRAMGTTYHIKVPAGCFDRTAKLRENIERRLKEISDSMSVYESGSEISRFNAIRNTEERLAVSEDFYHVINAAAKLHRLTEGAWDGTIKPLVDLWGFGRVSAPKQLPAKEHVERLLAQVGFNHIEIWESRHIRKKKPSLSLDLNSMAKGYAVDRIAALLQADGITDFLVEIGGEVYASGTKKKGQPWRVGINRPLTDASVHQIHRVVALQNCALATSGDYRRFFEIGGRRYSHVLDPRTGYPARHSVVSASVMAATCMFADGLATALMVMGPDTGLELVERLDHVEAMVVIQSADGGLVDSYSSGFQVLQ